MAVWYLYGIGCLTSIVDWTRYRVINGKGFLIHDYFFCVIRETLPESGIENRVWAFIDDPESSPPPLRLRS